MSAPPAGSAVNVTIAGAIGAAVGAGVELGMTKLLSAQKVTSPAISAIARLSIGVPVLVLATGLALSAGALSPDDEYMLPFLFAYFVYAQPHFVDDVAAIAHSAERKLYTAAKAARADPPEEPVPDESEEPVSDE